MSNNQSNPMLREFGCNSPEELLELITFNAMYDFLDWAEKTHFEPEEKWKHPDYLTYHVARMANVSPDVLHKRKQRIHKIVKRALIQRAA